MRAILCAGLLAGLLPATVHAHATLETGTAPADSTYKAVIRIGHGCAGEATNTLRVRIPEGVIAVKPMPKAGWELSVVEGDYTQAYDYYGRELTRGVREVVWSGGSLPDAFYDEFVLRAHLTAFEPGTIVYFPVVQECENGAERWIEIPEPGQDPHDLEGPAPSVTITEAGDAH